MTEQDLAHGIARADLCRFLAACYYEPGPEFAEEKLFDSMLAAASVVDAGLAARVRRLGAAFAAESPRDLLIEYTRLFLGPIAAPAKPYGSVWMEDANVLMGDSTVAVLDLYGEGGFEIAEDFRDLPDHVCVELEFLYALLLREAQASHAGGAEECAKARGLARRLLERHLGRWIAPFTDAMAGNAQTAFYRELAGLTAAFVEEEVRRSRAA
jgi:putative dimethyl sulfoxide reductase chaperone